jgi:hypothetical protein
MPLPEYKVVHSAPGSIRLRIKELRHSVDFATRLRALLNASASVTETKVHPATASIEILYTGKDFSEARIKEQLAVAIKHAADPEYEIRMDLKVAEHVLQGLTAYEYLRVREIIEWREKPVSGFSNLSGKALSPIHRAADAMIPDSFLKKAVPLMDSVGENWHRDCETLKRQAKIDDLGQLKQISLEQCDHLAESVRHRALSLASIQGGASGIVGMAGYAVNADLFLRVSAQTIQRVGLCYGFAPETRLEQRFAWAILAVAMASSNQERQKAFSHLRDLQEFLYQEVIGDLIEETVEDELTHMTIEAVLHGVFARIVELEGADAIPGIGLAAGIANAFAVIEDVSTAAQHEFQLRWLLENQRKRAAPEPS